MATAPPPANTKPPYRPSTPPTNREAAFATQGVQPPSGLYLQAEDVLTCNVQAPVTFVPANIALILRFQRVDGDITLTKRAIPNGGAIGQIQVNMGEGWLLSATLSNTGGFTAEPGAIYATLSVQRDTPESGIQPWMLFADYLTQLHFPSWPYGRNLLSQEGPGRVRSVTGSLPAAGAEVSEAVPSNTRWRLLSIRSSFTASAAAGSRVPGWLLDDGANVFYQAQANGNLGAGQTVSSTFANVSYSDTTDPLQVYTAAFENIFLGPGFRIRSKTTGILAGDQYTAPQYVVQEWVSL